MQKILPKTLLLLAQKLPAPLYVVGGSVRDFLADLTPNSDRDWDICSTLAPETVAKTATELGFAIKAVYKNTGTLKLTDSEQTNYEYTRFRSDKYVRGTHTPVEIYFTKDIALDARRRDFTCNAVYYDIKNDSYLDPLNGISAVKEKRLTTVAPAEKVFSEDGLRLMRLARLSAQLNFTPDTQCVLGATQNCRLIKDISPQRIFTELTALLYADEKYGVTQGQYIGLQLLDKTKVLAELFPALALGKNMSQRADFHKYDVLEHSLRAVKYADKKVRFAALFHDVGKPFCTIRDGNSYAHPQEGARITEEVLCSLSAPKRLIEETKTLVALHMYDFNCQTSEKKLRRFFAENVVILEKLMLLKQADFCACMDDLSIAPTCLRWQKLLAKLREENAPLTLKELAVNGNDLLAIDIPKQKISILLKALLSHAVTQPQDNEKEKLSRLARAFLKNL